MSDEYTCNGWACTDCLMELANGESPADLTETELAERNAQIEARNAGYNLTLGMLREDHACATNCTVTFTDGTTREVRADDSPGAAYEAELEYDGAPVADIALHELETESDRGGECDCEVNTFSWSPCDVCGSSLGGERHAVSFWKITS